MWEAAFMAVLEATRFLIRSDQKSSNNPVGASGRLAHPLFWLAVVLVTGGCTTTHPPAEKSRTEKAYRWLCAQQGPHGILGNQDGESFAGLYPNAMAAMIFLERGDGARCERVLDFFLAKRKELKTTPGGFHQFYDAKTGETLRDSDRWMGDNCWLLIALNHYAARTKSDRYRALADDIADWLVSLQDGDGGIWAGHNKSGFMRHKSTEGNLDAFAALPSRPQAREKVGRWLWTQMWIEKEGRFCMGSTSDAPALDTSAWGVLALGCEGWPAMTFANKNLRRMKMMFANGALVDGYADFADKDRIWLEGTGEMACAYRVCDGTVQGKHLIRELEKAMVPSQTTPGTLTIPCFTNDPAWDGGDTKGFVPSVCWYLFAQRKFNPMHVEEIRNPKSEIRNHIK
jgi:hypothetical protein